ncbi:unnamed protein product, partial [Nesidiocoris tenuis]
RSAVGLPKRIPLVHRRRRYLRTFPHELQSRPFSCRFAHVLQHESEARIWENRIIIIGDFGRTDLQPEQQFVRILCHGEPYVEFHDEVIRNDVILHASLRKKEMLEASNEATF